MLATLATCGHCSIKAFTICRHNPQNLNTLRRHVTPLRRQFLVNHCRNSYKSHQDTFKVRSSAGSSLLCNRPRGFSRCQV